MSVGKINISLLVLPSVIRDPWLNSLTKSNPGSIMEQNQTNVHETPWEWWFDFDKRWWKSPSNKGKQTPLAKSERPMLKNIKTNPSPISSFGSIRQGSTLKNLVILRSNFCVILTDSLCLRLRSELKRPITFGNWFWHPIVGNRSIVLNFYQQRPVFA